MSFRSSAQFENATPERMSYRGSGFDRYGNAYFDSDPRGSARSRRERKQRMEDDMEAEQYRQLMTNQQEMDHYRQLQGNPQLATGTPGMLQPPSPYYPEDLPFSPPGLSREEAMLGLAAPAPTELDLFRSARCGPESPPDMSILDDMLAGFDQMRYGMNVMDRDFDLFGPAPTSGVAADPYFDDAYPSIERGRPDPMAAFYGEPREYPPRTPRRRRGRSVTSGYELPAGASGNPGTPRDLVLQDHLMGTPEANMLSGARPLPDLRGTPMPPGFDELERMPERRRNNRWYA